MGGKGVVLVDGVESLNVLYVFSVIWNSVSFNCNASAQIQVPSGTQDAGYLVGLIAVG